MKYWNADCFLFYYIKIYVNTFVLQLIHTIIILNFNLTFFYFPIFLLYIYFYIYISIFFYFSNIINLISTSLWFVIFLYSFNNISPQIFLIFLYICSMIIRYFNSTSSERKQKIVKHVVHFHSNYCNFSRSLWANIHLSCKHERVEWPVARIKHGAPFSSRPL